MEHHFSWFSLLKDLSPWIANPEHAHVVHLIMVFSILILCGALVRMKMARLGPQERLLPAGNVGLYGLFQFAIEFLTNLVTDTMGHHGRRYTPLFASVFLTIFLSNLLGLIPGFLPPTSNLNTTLALGVVIFIIYNAEGLREGGLTYIKHFFGPLAYLAPLIFVIEIISHLIRPMALALRLRGNINGDHLVFGVFNDIIPGIIPNELIQWIVACMIPLPFLALGLLVSFIQAFVFTLLSMIYLALATEHEH